jgi:Undecaprenyl-phosphate galactose phosphotransferase WbaP
MVPTNRQKAQLSVNYKPWLVSILLAFSDILAITLSYAAAILIRVSLLDVMGGEVQLENLTSVFFLTLILVVGLFLIGNLYPGIGRTGVTELKEILKFITICYVFLGLSIFIFRVGSAFSRLIFFMTWVFASVLIPFFRIILHNRGSLISWWSQPVVVVGGMKDVQTVISHLHRARRMAIRPVVALITEKNYQAETVNGIPFYPYSLEVQNETRDNGIKMALFASQSTDMKRSEMDYLYSLSLSFSKLIYVMGESALSSLSMKPLDLEGRPALRVQYSLLNPWAMRVKRLIDLVLCVLGSVIISPLLLFFAALIKLDSPGPVIYTQDRMGKDGKIIKLFKFRTMVVDSDRILRDMLKNDPALREEYRKHHKLRNDPRVTRVGRFLRKISLDELPQVINVLRGEMSLVGPRAYLPEEREQMGDSVKLILRVSPGMTGWWQVMGRHDVTFKERLRLDKFYISNFSLWMDVYILIKTIWIVISAKGA